MVAILLAVIGVLVGVVIGLFIGKGMATPAITGTTAATSGSSVPAPQLTQDQLNAGQLPSGHPDISGLASSTATTPGK
jgi:hypothetical protein